MLDAFDAAAGFERQEDEGKFLVIGCHFGRGEKPFEYDLLLNKYA